MIVGLVGGGYVAVLALHALLLVGLLAARRREVGEVRMQPRMALRGTAVALLALGVRLGLPATPQVYFDEFYYLSTARHIRAEATITPSRSQVPMPPYPQGWPLLLAASGERSYAAAVALQKALGVATALAAFAMLAGESLAAATYAGAAMAVLPVLLRLACGASAEGSSVLFVVLALWACRSQRFRPGLAGALLAGGAVAWAAHFRPENLLYAPLFLAVARGSRGMSTLLCAAFIFPDLAILLEGARGLHAADHFVAVPRPGFSSMGANAIANLGNNAAFLFDGRILPLWITALALLGSWMLWRQRHRLPLAFYWAWIVGFTVVLSPFPFGDFRAAHSTDTWRFSWHVTLPLVLLGARAVERLARGWWAAVAAAVLVTPWLYAGWVAEPHPMAGMWDAARQAAREIGDGVATVPDDNLAMMLEAGCGVRVGSGAYLVQPGSELPAGWDRVALRHVATYSWLSRVRLSDGTAVPGSLTVWARER